MPRPGGDRHVELAAQRAEPVGQPAQARAAAGRRAADAVVGDADLEPAVAGPRLGADACAYLATLVSASETVK